MHASTSIIQPHPFTSDHGKTVSDGRYTESNSSKYAAVQRPIHSLIDVPSLALVKDFIADMARGMVFILRIILILMKVQNIDQMGVFGSCGGLQTKTCSRCL